MPFGSLWLPVVVSAVAVFIVSSIVHMVLKYHKADYKRLSDEDSVRQAVGKLSLGPGLYMMPYCAEASQMKDPAMERKYEAGPVAFLTVLRNGIPNLGKHLLQWFLFCLLVSFVTSYLARNTLAPGAYCMTILRITGTVAFIGYGFGYIQDSIWKGIPWSNSLRGLLDAVLYALTTAVVFCWLWPAS